MKHTVVLAILAGSLVVSCGPMSGPISDSGVNPLTSPGRQAGGADSKVDGLAPGQFVTARIDGTAFFINQPEGEAVADELLIKGTSMRVIDAAQDFTRVELDSGVIGYVMTVLLEPAKVVEPEVPEAPPAPKLSPSEFKPSPLYGDSSYVPEPARTAAPAPAPARRKFSSGGGVPLPPNDEDLERMQNQR